MSGKTIGSSLTPRLKRAMVAPDMVKCHLCDGLGNTIVMERDEMGEDWHHRSLKLCPTCQTTGLKAIPDSEVNKT
jgi:hypothetical protein